jgi:hypothetical protein
MSARVCEICFNTFNSSSEIVAHYRQDHAVEESEGGI